MSTEKPINQHPGAPGAKRSPENAGFDLFRTFRHPPKPADPLRAPRPAIKPKE
jgi:hypothetical protein